MELFQSREEIARKTLVELGKDLPIIDIDQVKKWIILNQEIHSYQELYDCLPYGWTKYNTDGFILKPVRLLMEKFDFEFKSVRIGIGNLVVKVHSPDRMIKIIVSRAIRTTRNYSISYCMVCGAGPNISYRRKGTYAQPVLCRVHFIQYINLKDL